MAAIVGAIIVLAVLAFVALRSTGRQSGSGPTPIAVAPSPAASATARSTDAGQKVYALSLCGSNTIGSQLGPDLVHAYFVAVGGDGLITSAGNDEQTVSGDVNGKPLKVHVTAHGSATAFTGLQSGNCQVGMASRRIKPEESGTLSRLGNMTSSRAEHVIGLDGIAVIVNGANTVDSLTTDALKAIFAGKVTTWQPFGGNGHIDVFARDAKSGTFDMFKSLVLGDSPLAASAKRFEDSARLSSAVSSDPNAIGFIGLPYVAQAKALRIASGGTPIAPNALTVGRESYPLTRRLFLYTAVNPTNPLVSKFVAFVQSDAGQAIVNKDGFVGTVTSLATSRSNGRNLPASAPEQYRELVNHLDQVSFNFYFNTGSDALDNKALVDVGRLVDIMASSANRSKKVVLVGFADSTGDPHMNQALSENRAKSAAGELAAQGINVQRTLGFGAEMPIRDNATEAGRQKNRRVEIFITR